MFQLVSNNSAQCRLIPYITLTFIFPISLLVCLMLCSSMHIFNRQTSIYCCCMIINDANSFIMVFFYSYCLSFHSTDGLLPIANPVPVQCPVKQINNL